MKIVAISDTHCGHEELELPEGDVLVHAGDFSHRRNKESVRGFLDWFEAQPHPRKILIAGNHDGLFETDPEWCAQYMEHMNSSFTYLQDSGCEIDGVKFWGSPWQPEFNNWHFNLPRGMALANKWARIPDDTDVLITHGPPLGIMDECAEWHPTFGLSRRSLIHVGCKEMATALERVNPKIHIFGHIHEGAGVLEQDGCTYINAASMDGSYDLVHPPRIVEIWKTTTTSIPNPNPN